MQALKPAGSRLLHAIKVLDCVRPSLSEWLSRLSAALSPVTYLAGLASSSSQSGGVGAIVFSCNMPDNHSRPCPLLGRGSDIDHTLCSLFNA